MIHIADIRAAYAGKVEAFEAITWVYTAAEGGPDRQRSDLPLLDLYLPDEHGLDLVARLRREKHLPVDVIVITTAKDADGVRVATPEPDRGTGPGTAGGEAAGIGRDQAPAWSPTCTGSPDGTSWTT
jgi:CheY-like chemotaxis protein